jgi:2-dehydro-3-deoxyphosphogalactonate aldolase
VLTVEDVARVRDAGGRLVVSPSTDPEVIAATVAAGNGVFARLFHAVGSLSGPESGRHCLEAFSGRGASPAILKAQRAVLPKDVPVLVVGGVRPDNMREWLDAGANGFGLGSGVYKPGQSPDEVAALARAYVKGIA